MRIIEKVRKEFEPINLVIENIDELMCLVIHLNSTDEQYVKSLPSFLSDNEKAKDANSKTMPIYTLLSEKLRELIHQR